MFPVGRRFLRLERVDEATRDLVLAADGDPSAFDRVVRATERDVRRFLSWWGQPGDDLDDLVQETYLRAFRGLSTFRGDAPARSWLVSIARRATADHVARGARIKRSAAAVADCPVVVSSSIGAAELVDVIRSLPQDQLEAFVLVRVMGYSYDEAACIIGCPRGTVQSRVARARLRLVEALREELPSNDELRGVKSGDRAGRAAG